MDNKMAATATLRVKPGKMAGLVETIRDFVALTRQEPGCEVFSISQSLDDPELFILWEVFTNEAALQEHLAKPYTQELFALDLFDMVSHVRHTAL